ncbi:hypothetical protein KFL_003620120 [Klebsormidium nitens]|uniref:Uncharacterized protein n=1 Tax=Klebsormidium nitens TaxID=105231 RepID=A0A1Y1IES6_KLENI|nr:hypothetical protein KFL_003620120 [Klebsormidium nitens]|eukprot:GAQ87581.1 hypothetical protein KFL_003620120 [Klebsormidium nitens]
MEFGGSLPKWIRRDCIPAGVLVAVLSGFGVAALYLAYLGLTTLHAAPLPDPASLTQFLHSSGHNVTLCRCMVRSAFQVYIGFSGSCGQIEDYLYPGVSLTIDKKRVYRHTGALPDPATLNPFLLSSGQNLTLHLCTVRGAFQVYIGFSDSCNQVGDFLYPGISLTKDNDHAFRHSSGMSALLFAAAWMSFTSWACIIAGLVCHSAGLLYRCCFLRQKVYSIEMQAPAGSAV